MAAAFHFELVSPDKLLFSGDVESVLVPGIEGDFTVMQGHAPLMTVLRPGLVEVADTAGKTSKLFVRGGFVDVSPAGLTLLAETALPLDSLDSARLSQEIKDASEDVKDAGDDELRRKAQEKVDRLNELKTALGH